MGNCSDSMNTYFLSLSSFGAKVGYHKNCNLHFPKPFVRLAIKGMKNTNWRVSKFSETLILFVFDWTRNERTTGRIASIQGTDLKR